MKLTGVLHPRRLRRGCCRNVTLLLLVLAVASVAGFEDVVVARGSDWRFLDTGSNQGTAWRALSFDDSSWKPGNGEFGYGTDTFETFVSFGTDPNQKPITVYFRTTFSLVRVEDFVSGALGILRDDGAVAYLNGVEVGRTNMPTGVVSFDTRAPRTSTAQEEGQYLPLDVPVDALVEGMNVLAVEVHQAAPDSSDIAFDAELVLTTSFVMLVRGPYLSVGTPTSIVVRWYTDEAVDSAVTYGTDPEALTSQVSSAAPTTAHELTLTGLQPDTTYYYALLTGPGPEDTGTTLRVMASGEDFHFRSAPVTGTGHADGPTRFLITGDPGTGDLSSVSMRDGWRRWLAASAGPSPDGWLILGDNAYESGTTEEFQDHLFAVFQEELRTSALWPVMGNHDGFTSVSSTQRGPFFDLFTMPSQAESGGVASNTEAYYAFDHGNVHVVVLDSYDTPRDADEPMAVWLDADLAQASGNAGIRWIMVAFHHPPYSKGSHDSDARLHQIEMRENIVPILDRYGVDLVFSGHSHSYERTPPIAGHYGFSSTFDETTMVKLPGFGDPDRDGAYTKPTARQADSGVVYIVTGNAGQTSEGDFDHPAMLEVNPNPVPRPSGLIDGTRGIRQLGAVVVDATDTRLEVSLVDEAGATVDHFAIDKGPSPSPTPTLSRTPTPSVTAAASASPTPGAAASTTASPTPVSAGNGGGSTVPVADMVEGTGSGTAVFVVVAGVLVVGLLVAAAVVRIRQQGKTEAGLKVAPQLEEDTVVAVNGSTGSDSEDRGRQTQRSSRRTPQPRNRTPVDAVVKVDVGNSGADRGRKPHRTPRGGDRRQVHHVHRTPEGRRRSVPEGSQSPPRRQRQHRHRTPEGRQQSVPEGSQSPPRRKSHHHHSHDKHRRRQDRRHDDGGMQRRKASESGAKRRNHETPLQSSPAASPERQHARRSSAGRKSSTRVQPVAPAAGVPSWSNMQEVKDALAFLSVDLDRLMGAVNQTAAGADRVEAVAEPGDGAIPKGVVEAAAAKFGGMTPSSRRHRRRRRSRPKHSWAAPELDDEEDLGVAGDESVVPERGTILVEVAPSGLQSPRAQSVAPSPSQAPGGPRPPGSQVSLGGSAWAPLSPRQSPESPPRDTRRRSHQRVLSLSPPSGPDRAAPAPLSSPPARRAVAVGVLGARTVRQLLETQHVAAPPPAPVRHFMQPTVASKSRVASTLGKEPPHGRSPRTATAASPPKRRGRSAGRLSQRMDAAVGAFAAAHMLDFSRALSLSPPRKRAAHTHSPPPRQSKSPNKSASPPCRAHVSPPRKQQARSPPKPPRSKTSLSPRRPAPTPGKPTMSVSPRATQRKSAQPWLSAAAPKNWALGASQTVSDLAYTLTSRIVPKADPNPAPPYLKVVRHPVVVPPQVSTDDAAEDAFQGWLAHLDAAAAKMIDSPDFEDEELVPAEAAQVVVEDPTDDVPGVLPPAKTEHVPDVPTVSPIDPPSPHPSPFYDVVL